MEGIISKHSISITINSGSKLSYIPLQVLEYCVLLQNTHVKSCLVKLSTRNKKKVSNVIEKCLFHMSGIHT